MKSLKYVVKRRLHQSNCKMANFSGIFHHWEDLGKCVGVHETFCGVTRGVRQKNFLSTCANRWREKRSENRKIASMPNLVRYTFIYSYGNDWFQSLLVSDFAFSLKLMKYDWRGNWRRCQPNIYDQGNFMNSSSNVFISDQGWKQDLIGRDSRPVLAFALRPSIVASNFIFKTACPGKFWRLSKHRKSFHLKYEKYFSRLCWFTKARSLFLAALKFSCWRITDLNHFYFIIRELWMFQRLAVDISSTLNTKVIS